jgi:hypothetical protein
VQSKVIHPTAISISAVQFDVYTQAILTFMDVHSWTSVAVIYETEVQQPFYFQLATSFIAYSRSSSAADRIQMLTFPVQSTDYDFGGILKRIKASARSQ